MNFRELRNHIKNKIPFLVYGDVCRYDPAIHTGDPHEWYRTALHRAEIAVNIEDEAQYWRKQNKLREQVDDLQRELESVRAENVRLRAECETAEKLTPDELAALARYRKERDSDNEYTPWISEGLTEAQYFQRLYLANSNLLAVAEQVISAFVYPSAPMTPAQKEAWTEWTRLHG